MAAHLVEIDRRCQTCNKRATVELFNTWNASNGFYCRSCGNQALKRLLVLERGGGR